MFGKTDQEKLIEHLEQENARLVEENRQLFERLMAVLEPVAHLRTQRQARAGDQAPPMDPREKAARPSMRRITTLVPPHTREQVEASFKTE